MECVEFDRALAKKCKLFCEKVAHFGNNFGSHAINVGFDILDGGHRQWVLLVDEARVIVELNQIDQKGIIYFCFQNVSVVFSQTKKQKKNVCERNGNEKDGRKKQTQSNPEEQSNFQ